MAASKQSQQKSGPARREPERTCVGCGASAKQCDLLRVVVGPNGEVAVDLGRRSFGRSAWLHPRENCVQRASRNGFAKSFRRPIQVDGTELLGQIRQAAKQRALSLVGSAIARRAVVFGSDQVRSEAQTLKVVLLAEDALAAAREPWLAGLAASGRLVIWATKADYGALFGRMEVAVMGVIDEGIAKAVVHAIGLARLGIINDTHVASDARTPVAEREERVRLSEDQ